MNKLIFSFWTIILIGSRLFAGDPLKFDGPPSLATTSLNSDSFVSFQTKKIKNPRLDWINENYLLEQGFDLSKGVTEELSKKLTDAWGYIVPAPDIDPEFFMDETKLFYADRYGGLGGDGASGDPDSLGSGRAASAGDFNIKGIGRTPLASSQDPNVIASKKVGKGLISSIKHYFSARHHLHGGATLRESTVEAIWSEILHRELPFGSNRVIAIISMDQTIEGDRRALIIRENSLRPAHYMRAYGGKKNYPEAEKERIRKLTLLLRNELPRVDETGLNPNEVFHKQLLLVTERVASQYATAFVKNFYHGATSPSNIELSAKALDHGPMTGVDGFSSIRFADEYANGDWNNVVNDIFFEFFEDLKETLDIDLQSYVPNHDEISKSVETAYKTQMQKTFLWRLGIPNYMIDKYFSLSLSPQLADTLYKIAVQGNDRIYNSASHIPRNTGEYNFSEIVKILIKSNPNANDLNRALELQIKDSNLRFALIYGYLGFIQELEKVVGVSSLEIVVEAREKVDRRNRGYSDLFRGPRLWAKQITIIKFSKWFGLKNIISNFINGMIEANGHYDVRPKLVSPIAPFSPSLRPSLIQCRDLFN